MGVMECGQRKNKGVSIDHVLSLFKKDPQLFISRKYSVMLSGHSTSVYVEPYYWLLLKKVAKHHGISLASLIAYIDGYRLVEQNLSSMLRFFIASYLNALYCQTLLDEDYEDN